MSCRGCLRSLAGSFSICSNRRHERVSLASRPVDDRAGQPSRIDDSSPRRSGGARAPAVDAHRPEPRLGHESVALREVGAALDINDK